ncbi:LamG-like jellyroll fold domain-containing protein [Candidatus Latescibacterota bacterium]
MQRHYSVITFVFVIIITISSPALATVQGTVMDTDGNPVAGATLKFVQTDYPDNVMTSTTGTEGRYSIDFTVGVKDDEVSVPDDFSLGHNYPNPFNPTTTIPFSLDQSSHITLSVYNIIGQKVITLIDSYTSAGKHSVIWNGLGDNGKMVAAGTYIYQLHSKGKVENKKMLLVDGGSFRYSNSKNILNNANSIHLSKPALIGKFIIMITGPNIFDYIESDVVLSDGMTRDFVVSSIDSFRPITHLNPIFYIDGAFTLSWPVSTYSDFALYRLYESTTKEMGDEREIYSSDDLNSTKYTDANIPNGELRYYRLDVENSLGLVTHGTVRAAFANSNIVPNVPEDGLLAYHPLDETAEDRSTYHHDGVIEGPIPTSDRNDDENRAYYFDGNDQIIISGTSDFNDLASFTVSAWIYPTEVNTHNTIISKVKPNRDFVLKITWSGQLEIHFAHSATYYVCYTGEVIPLFTWTHVAITWDGTMWKIYIDGVPVKETDYTGYAPLWTGSIMAIGSMNEREKFTGKIDEVRIYNHRLNDDEITRLYYEL